MTYTVRGAVLEVTEWLSYLNDHGGLAAFDDLRSINIMIGFLDEGLRDEETHRLFIDNHESLDDWFNFFGTDILSAIKLRSSLQLRANQIIKQTQVQV